MLSDLLSVVMIYIILYTRRVPQNDLYIVSPLYTHTSIIFMYKVRVRGENVFTNFAGTPTTENAVLYITLLCVLY